jgi:phosphoribosylformylglycinamidine (FGAM) synthase-like enzyme
MIGGLGVVPDVRRLPRSPLLSDQVVLVLGALSDEPGAGHYTRLRYGRDLGVPRCDLVAEQRLARLLIDLIADGCVAGLAVVSHGGLLTALAKLCLRSEVGLQMELPTCLRPHYQALGEHPAQVLAWLDRARLARLHERAREHGIASFALGIAGGRELALGGHGAVPLSALRHAWQGETRVANAATDRTGAHVS